MRARFRHATHVVRVAMVFLVGFLGFAIARVALIPSDFGKYGFYRAGALDEIRALPLAHAGMASCENCHAGTYWSDADDAKAVFAANPKQDNRHSALKCEACHGALYFHKVAKEKEEEEDAKEASGKAAENTEPAPAATVEKPVAKVAADKLCLNCHQEITGRPAFQPQVVVGDHGDQDKCDSCHKPHRPRTDEDVE